ncbi:hypothetical protein WH47_10916 [Habropoda laboriosa]|uniref:DDE-1 domain-containing protein n=1 Tax=Habropoda laboriosa TaxID=597456 RepID=A0A0L7QKL2_9HYME|nr:hypothetical protein WH47_10916 [Habropoda laboriosa]
MWSLKCFIPSVENYLKQKNLDFKVLLILDNAPNHPKDLNHPNVTIASLHRKFPGGIISRQGNINWPPRSCDLTPPDFFLWDYVKEKVYANNPKSILQLKDNI